LVLEVEHLGFEPVKGDQVEIGDVEQDSIKELGIARHLLTDERQVYYNLEHIHKAPHILEG
jgi:hypothetical protein